MTQILLVEDDLEICEILQFYLLKQSNYNVTVAHSSKEARMLTGLRNYDLILMDIMLPDQDGLSLCEELRKTMFCPIIFISCLGDDETVIRALNMGGDDYLIKPFQAPVLLARIEANLRRCARSNTRNAETFRVGALHLDPALRTVTKNGEPVTLSPTEYELLHFFMRNPGRFIRFEELYSAVWQRPSMGGPAHAVRAHRASAPEDRGRPVPPELYPDLHAGRLHLFRRLRGAAFHPGAGALR